MVKRVFNFNPGPATLPLSVLQTVQEELLNYHGEGMSLMEMSHRSKTFDQLVLDTEAIIRDIIGFSDDYHVLFLQGGATAQFAAVPLNLSVEGKQAEYINTGSWSKKAIQEVEKLGKPFKVIASSKDDNFSYIPADYTISPEASYLHLTSNNTIFGTQWQSYPDTGDVPLIVDMSSDFYCRRLNPEQFALIYAGAQKNAGPSGVTIILLRDDLLERVTDNIPTILNYKSFAEKHSLYNTPNTFGIYVVNLVMNWIKSQGGIDKVEEMNNRKASLIYETLDASDFYMPHARKDSRSIMNIVWRLNTEELEKLFVEEAKKNDLVGLKGHRSVGGIRASIYNAMTHIGTQALVDFMKEFERVHG
jgi:phosphoserine aminotransferase